jgi:hypothetical protein
LLAALVIKFVICRKIQIVGHVAHNLDYVHMAYSKVTKTALPFFMSSLDGTGQDKSSCELFNVDVLFFVSLFSPNNTEKDSSYF